MTDSTRTTRSGNTSFRWEYMNRRNDVRNIGGPPVAERKSPLLKTRKQLGGALWRHTADEKRHT